MATQAEVLAQVFDDKTVRIIEKILEKSGTFYLRELAKETGVSLATTFRIVQHLLKLGVVEKQAHGKFNFYRVKQNSALFKELGSLILGRNINLMDLLKQEIPDKKIFQSSKNPKEFFVVSNEDIETTVIVAKIKQETGVGIKLRVLNEGITNV